MNTITQLAQDKRRARSRRERSYTEATASAQSPNQRRFPHQRQAPPHPRRQVSPPRKQSSPHWRDGFRKHPRNLSPSGHIHEVSNMMGSTNHIESSSTSKNKGIVLASKGSIRRNVRHNIRYELSSEATIEDLPTGPLNFSIGTTTTAKQSHAKRQPLKKKTIIKRSWVLKTYGTSLPKSAKVSYIRATKSSRMTGNKGHHDGNSDVNVTLAENRSDCALVASFSKAILPNSCKGSMVFQKHPIINDYNQLELSRAQKLPDSSKPKGIEIKSLPGHNVSNGDQ
ncbi:unnamed protein product [Cochlearia groenlandica]